MVTVTDTPTLSYTITRTISITIDVTPTTQQTPATWARRAPSTPPLWPTATRRRRGPSSTSR